MKELCMKIVLRVFQLSSELEERQPDITLGGIVLKPLANSFAIALEKITGQYVRTPVCKSRSASIQTI